MGKKSGIHFIIRIFLKGEPSENNKYYFCVPSITDQLE